MTMYKTLVMTILALVGVFCYRKKIVDQEINKKLSELVLSLFTPVLLFTSFQKDFSKELVTGLMISVLFLLHTSLYSVVFHQKYILDFCKHYP